MKHDVHFGGESLARIGFGIAAGLVLIGSVIHAISYDFVSDDAFIVARYARNWIEGLGPVFNPGERVEGYTSFIGLSLTAGLGAIGIEPADAVRVVSFAGYLLAILAAMVVVYRAVRPENRWFAVAAGVLAGTAGPFACWALAGLEGPLFAFLVLLAAVLAGSAGDNAVKVAVAGLVAGLAALTRPEGMLLGGALFLWLVVFNPGGSRKKSWLHPVMFAVVVGSHLAWRYAYYGDILPNTFYAKMGLNSSLLARGFSYVVSYATDQGGVLVWLLPLAVAFVVRAPAVVRACAFSGLVMVCAVMFEGGDGLPMYRFMVPVIPLWAVASGYLLSRLWDLIRSFDSDAVRRIGRAVVLGSWLTVSACQVAAPELLNQYGMLTYQRDTEIPNWTLAGKWLKAHAPAGASIACVPIGAVGYYSGLRVVDMMGLTDRHIARVATPVGGGWAGHEKHDGPYVLSRNPDYLLLGNIMVAPVRIPVDHPMFGKPGSQAIQRREADMFTDDMLARYEPVVDEISPGLFFHYFRRKAP